MSNPLMSFGGFHHVFKQVGFKTEILQLIQDMFDLTSILEAHHFEITPNQIQESSKKRCQIRDRLLALSKAQSSQLPSDPVLQACL